MQNIGSAIAAILVCGCCGAAYGVVAGVLFGWVIGFLSPFGAMLGLLGGAVGGFIAGVLGSCLGGRIGWAIGGFVGGAAAHLGVEVMMPGFFGEGLSFFSFLSIVPGIIGASLGLFVAKMIPEAGYAYPLFNGYYPLVNTINRAITSSALVEWPLWKRAIIGLAMLVPLFIVSWLRRSI